MHARCWGFVGLLWCDTTPARWIWPWHAVRCCIWCILKVLTGASTRGKFFVLLWLVCCDASLIYLPRHSLSLHLCRFLYCTCVCMLVKTLDSFAFFFPWYDLSLPLCRHWCLVKGCKVLPMNSLFLVTFFSLFYYTVINLVKDSLCYNSFSSKIYGTTLISLQRE